MSSSSQPKLLFVLTSDPRKTARPAEAIRAAAGLGAWKKTEITVYLRGPAILALGEWVDELRDEDNYTRYLPLLADSGRPIYVQTDAPEIAELGEATQSFTPITDEQLAEMAAAATSVLRF